MQRLLTIREVADLLAVSRQTVYRLINLGELRAVKVAGVHRFKPEDVQEFIERSRR